MAAARASSELAINPGTRFQTMMARKISVPIPTQNSGSRRSSISAALRFEPVTPLPDGALDHGQRFAPQHQKQQAERHHQPEDLAGEGVDLHLGQYTGLPSRRPGAFRRFALLRHRKS